MSLLDTLKAKLDPDLFAQVTDALGDDFDYDLVSRARLNTVIGQREAAKRALQRQQIGGTETATEPDGDQFQMQQLMLAMLQALGASTDQQMQNQQQSLLQSQAAAMLPGAQQKPQVMTKEQQDAAIAAEVQKQVNQVKQQYAITEKLREANVVDPALVLSGGLLDTAQLKWSEVDPAKLESGFDEQLAALTESRPYLFQQPQGSGFDAGTGRAGVPGGVGTVSTYQDFTKLPYEQQLSFKQAHPDVFKGFMQQAGIVSPAGPEGGIM